MKKKFSEINPAIFVFILSFLFFFTLQSNWPAAADEKILFLHHSTGGNVYDEGNVAGWIAGYNTTNSTNYQIEERAYPNTPYPWKNYPYDYWNLWINGQCDSDYSGIECLESILSQYDVVIFKHCFPGSDILVDTGEPDIGSSVKSQENYKLQYRALRNLMDSFPEKTFILWTLAPRHRLATNAENAARASQFVDWVKNDYLSEDGKSRPHIYIFDFWGLAAEQEANPENGETNCLRYEFERSHYGTDSHPNTLANETVGPIFAETIINYIDSPDTATQGNTVSFLNLLLLDR